MIKLHQKIKVGLAQINNSFSGQNYLPYSVGILQAYAEKNLKNPDGYEFLLPLYTRIPVDAAVVKLTGARVAFFSAYVWNIRISLAIAKALKEKQPGTIVVFGGPQVPDKPDEFIREHPFIDLVVHGEGEQVFAAILENLEDFQRESVPSCSFLGPDGSVVHTPKVERLKDLAGVPSPYLGGTFDALMKAYPKEKWIVLWETNRGCPFSCSFCDWGSAIQTKVAPFDLERLHLELEWFAARRIEFIFCADANFGILPRDVDISRYAAETKKKFGYPHALSVQNTKNATDRAFQVQKTLAEAGMNKGVTLALQSLDPMTLQSIKRANISTKSYHDLQQRFQKENIETYTDMILALPGETYDSFAEGVSTLIENGQHNRIQFNNLSLLPNAEMGDARYQEKFGMVHVESKIINIHGSLDEGEDEIFETQQLVIATNTMPKEDWVKTRAFCWMAALLHFDKILQIPLIWMHETGGVSYRKLLEMFFDASRGEFPILDEIKIFFQDKARDIQNGGPEYCRSEQFLNIYWPVDELILIKLCAGGKLDAFYREAETLLASVWKNGNAPAMAPAILQEAIELNKSLLKLPFQTEDLSLRQRFNIWEFYQSVLRSEPTPLIAKESCYHIDRTGKTWSSWDDWCREVVWYGNKKGAYLYGYKSDPEGQLAGHF